MSNRELLKRRREAQETHYQKASALLRFRGTVPALRSAAEEGIAAGSAAMNGSRQTAMGSAADGKHYYSHPAENSHRVLGGVYADKVDVCEMTARFWSLMSDVSGGRTDQR